MDGQEYTDLLDYLTEGAIRTISPTVRDCNIPEDPDFPPPYDQPTLSALFHKLPDYAQFLCWLTAAQMIQPIWDDYVRMRGDTLNPDYHFLPTNVVATAQGLLNGWYTELQVMTQSAILDNQLIQPAMVAQNIADAPVPWSTVGYYAAAASRYFASNPTGMAMSVFDAARAYALTMEDEHAAQAAAETQQRIQQRPRLSRRGADMRRTRQNQLFTEDFTDFLARWWQTCRCLLPFFINEDVELEWPEHEGIE